MRWQGTETEKEREGRCAREGEKERRSECEGEGERTTKREREIERVCACARVEEHANRKTKSRVFSCSRSLARPLFFHSPRSLSFSLIAVPLTLSLYLTPSLFPSLVSLLTRLPLAPTLSHTDSHSPTILLLHRVPLTPAIHLSPSRTLLALSPPISLHSLRPLFRPLSRT